MKASLFLFLIAAPAAFAGPFQPERIPAQANWYVHADLTAMRETTTGGILMNFIGQEQGKALAEFENLLEFDPLTDLTGVTLFGSGKNQDGALIVSGKFDQRHLEQMISNAENYQSSSHGATTVHQWDDQGKTQRAAFHNQQTLIISQQEELLHLGLDVLGGKEPGLPAETSLPSENPVAVGFANISQIDMPDDEGSRIIRQAKSIIITLNEKGDRLETAMVAKTDSNDTARRMRDILEGLVALGQLADQKIESLDINHKGNVSNNTMTMTMTMSVPTLKTLEILSQMK